MVHMSDGCQTIEDKDRNLSQQTAALDSHDVGVDSVPEPTQLEQHISDSGAETLLQPLPSGNTVKEMGSQKNMFRSDDLRPRSFSDVSIGSGKYGFLKALQQKLNVDRKTSMKVFIQRESTVLHGLKSDTKAGKVLSLDDLTSQHDFQDFAPPKPNLPKEYLLNDLAKTAPPKPALPKEYILNDYHDRAPPKPKLPKDFKGLAGQQLNNNSKHSLKWKESGDKQHPGESVIIKAAHQENESHHERSSNVRRIEAEHGARHRELELGAQHRELEHGAQHREMELGAGNRQHRASLSDFPRLASGVLYRHFDSKLQSELLGKELELLRTSRHVRRTSATMRSRLEGNCRPKSTGDLHVRFDDDTIMKTNNKDVNKVGLHKTTDSLGNKAEELVSRNQTVDPIVTKYNKYSDIPPSGRLDVSTVKSGITQTHVSRSYASQRGQDPARSKSASELGRIDNNLKLDKELKQIDASDKDLPRKSSPRIQRKHNTITKYHSDVIDKKREKVRVRYHQQGRRRLDTLDAEENEQVPSTTNSQNKSNLQDRIITTQGDNRSDEEKYAALSRHKLLHSKSFSLDSHLGKKQERVINKGKEQTPPKTLRQIRSSGNFPTSSMTTGANTDLTANNAQDKQVVYSDSECIVNKGARTSVVLSGAPTGKIVLRQCRLGSDVVFGLVGVQNPPVKKPNGNGYLDGQGLVTIRMIPDEQGRFGFNVKGGADQGMPIIVSRVAPNTPADNAIPRLNEGDQVLFINGRDVSQHTHEQVVMFIRASRETHSGELVLKVRPNAYSGEEDNSEEPDFVYDPETHQISSATGGANALDLSLKLLEESLESGAALAQFEQLYRKKPGMTMNVARLEENVPKNRYRDISPYDQTRVMIKDSPNGDYINANYVNMEIPVSGILNRYIAAQGPLPSTCVDFWQMVWEQQSTLVVMLTTKVERGRIKCHQYWPDLYDTQDYGHLQITCVKEEETASFAFREFTLTHVEAQEERHISHMQYIAWPDHGVPDDPADFLDFVQKVRQRRLGLVEPSIVHCSAGIGRTGVLITMETAMCLIEANQPVYPLSIVRQMRDQRAMLIQTPNQYKFVCEAIIRCYNEGLVKPLPEYQR